ncbi:MAG: hypothetical protein WBR24_00495 [Desulfobacterales bacterium]|jgi:hypothetical protein
MSQLIAVKNANGIVVAADSKALDSDTSGNITEYSINRLIKLSDRTAILAGGAGAGENMCRALKEFIAEERLRDIEAVYTAALPFLASEYQQFMRKSCAVLPFDPLHHIHFILAGYSGKNKRNPFQLYLLWTKKKLPQLDGDEITAAFSVPRLIRLEHRLTQMAHSDASLEKVYTEVRLGMERQAEIQEDVAGPMAYAVITRDGFQRKE